MVFETTLEKALFFGFATRIAPGDITTRKARRVVRQRIGAQTMAAVKATKVRLTEGGGFDFPGSQSEKEYDYLVKLNLEYEHLETLRNAMATAIWGLLRERQEDVVIAMADDVAAWIEQWRAKEVWHKMSPGERKLAMEASKSDGEDAE